MQVQEWASVVPNRVGSIKLTPKSKTKIETVRKKQGQVYDKVGESGGAMNQFQTSANRIDIDQIQVIIDDGNISSTIKQEEESPAIPDSELLQHPERSPDKATKKL